MLLIYSFFRAVSVSPVTGYKTTDARLRRTSLCFNNGCQASPDILMLNNRESPNSLFYDSPFLSFYTTSSILRMM